MSETTGADLELQNQYDNAQAQRAQADYFGYGETGRFIFPDGVTWIEFKSMNEGAKARYQRDTTRPILIEKGGNASTRVDPAGQRHALIEASVTDWNLTRNGKAFAFSHRFLKEFLESTDPKLVEDLELAIRKINPWLNDDMTVADIDVEIDRLRELRQEVQERELGEAGSADK